MVSIAWPVILQLIADIARIRFHFSSPQNEEQCGIGSFSKTGMRDITRLVTVHCR